MSNNEQELRTAARAGVQVPAHAAVRFDADAALADLATLCGDEFAGRRIGTPGHDLAQAWLLGRIREIGLAADLDVFEFVEPLLEQYSPPLLHVRSGGQKLQTLILRRDFAEHPRSADTPEPVKGIARRWVGEGTEPGAWAMLEAVPPGAGFDALVQDAAARGVVGILTPQNAHVDGFLSKRVIHQPAVSLPVVAVRTDLLPELEGLEVTAAVPLRAVPGRGANVLGRLVGSDPLLAAKPLVVSAHYDGVGDDPGGPRFPAASDNAAAVAIVLALAGVMSRQAERPQRTIIFALLDAEEVGAFGSLAHARLMREAGLTPLVLNVDGAACYHGEITVDPSADAGILLQALDEAGQALEIPLVMGPVQSDNRRYAGAGFAGAGIASGGYGYHTPADTLVQVEPEAMALVGRLLSETVLKLAY